MNEALLGVARDIPVPVLVGLPIAGTIMAAAASLLMGQTGRRAMSFIGVVVLTLDAALMVIRADADGPLVAQAGDWPAPFGITLVVDRLSSLLILVSGMVLFCVLLYAVGQGVPHDSDDEGGATDLSAQVFHPAYLLLAAGVSYSFTTGDLFNLFVAFEVMLAASYVLITVRAGREAVRASMTYIVASLLASTLLVSAVGLVYAATGTVNLAQLHAAMPEVNPALRTALGVMLICVFGIKTALFPLYFWLPDSYPAAPAPVTAVFAGLLTKVGVYAIIRTQLVMFGDDRSMMQPFLLIAAGTTLLFGILGALAQQEIKRILVFIIVSHIGFMVMGLAFFTVAGVAGAIFYVVHHIVMQTSIFCVEGLIERRTGTSALDQIGGLAKESPLLAGLFALPALSLAGFPPFSGFVGKIALFKAAVDVHSWGILAMATLVSLLTVFALSRIWVTGFWDSPKKVIPDSEEDDAVEVGIREVPAAMLWATILVVALGLAIPLFGGPLYGLCGRAAADLLDGTAYVNAVLGGGG